jgi:hypothetical protein
MKSKQSNSKKKSWFKAYAHLRSRANDVRRQRPFEYQDTVQPWTTAVFSFWCPPNPFSIMNVRPPIGIQLRRRPDHRTDLGHHLKRTPEVSKFCRVPRSRDTARAPASNPGQLVVTVIGFCISPHMIEAERI